MITVIAGVNGAGKSSILGSWIRAGGGDYFNPDEATRQLMKENPSLNLDQANSDAWKLGRDQLAAAIAANTDYTFETTLGGNSICQLLLQAMDQGLDVNIGFCGLSSPELHIQRVSERVAKGGHDIPESKIRERWMGAIHNMCALIPGCKMVTVFDNSAEMVDGKPAPKNLFSMDAGKFIVFPVADMPDWAKPLVAVAMNCHLQHL